MWPSAPVRNITPCGADLGGGALAALVILTVVLVYARGLVGSRCRAQRAWGSVAGRFRVGGHDNENGALGQAMEGFARSGEAWARARRRCVASYE